MLCLSYQIKTVGPEIQSRQDKPPKLTKMEPARMLESDRMDDRQQLSARRKKNRKQKQDYLQIQGNWNDEVPDQL